jgi:hypothetical protein
MIGKWMRSDGSRFAWRRTSLFVLLALGCQTPNGPILVEGECPSGQGEFPATDCAIGLGRAQDSAGSALVGLTIRVDSFVASVGYAYASGTAVTAADGRFELTVLRVNRLTPPATPDTVRIGLKAYRTPNPVPGQAPLDQAYALLRFAPMGTRVPKSVADVIFRLPP